MLKGFYDEMKIKVIASNPIEEQNHINELIGKEFETIPYREYDKETRQEMKELGEVGIMVGKYPYILNKDEYEVLEG